MYCEGVQEAINKQAELSSDFQVRERGGGGGGGGGREGGRDGGREEVE